MPFPWNLLLNPKVLAGLVIVAALAYAVQWHAGQVDENFDAGYDKRELELSKAADTAATNLNDAGSVENAEAIKLQKELAKSRKRSEALAAQIRDASFKCVDIGPRFVELYNAGTRAGGPLPAP